MPDQRSRRDPTLPSPGPLLRGYRGLSALAQPMVPLMLRYRAAHHKEDRARSGERSGVASAIRPSGDLVWLHASSVGETSAILPLMQSLAADRPDLTLLLTTGTRTSAEFAQSRMPEAAIHQFVPLDAPGFMGRFLDHWRPELALLTESEIWPNLILEASERGIPLILVNARISQKSFQRWQRWRSISHALFTRFQLILAQNNNLAQRFSQLGAKNVIAAGNLKIDAPPPVADARLLRDLKRETADRDLFLAASTHPGEEEAVTDVHKTLTEKHAKLLTIIAPRHPHRGDQIEALAAAKGLRVSRRSRSEPMNGSTDVYIADTIGELGLFYALAPVAFIGGSLVPHGGQNPVEAVKHKTAVITGPNVRNFDEAYGALRETGGCVEVTCASDLASRTDELLRNSLARARMVEQGAIAVEQMSGALETTLEAIGDWLPPPQA